MDGGSQLNKFVTEKRILYTVYTILLYNNCTVVYLFIDFVRIVCLLVL